MLRKVLSGVALGLAFLAFIFALVAVVTVRWYVIDTSTIEVQLGLKTMCVTDKTAGGGTTCEDIKLDTTHLTTCTRTQDDLQSRFFVVQGLVAASVFFIFVTLLLSGVLIMKSILIVKAVAVALSAINLLLIIVALAYFNSTLTSWFFCDMNFCDYFADFYAGQKCDAGLGYSCIFIIIVLVCLLLQIVFTCLAIKEHRPDAPARDGAHGPQWGHGKSHGKHSPQGGQSPRHGASRDDHKNHAKTAADEPVAAEQEEEEWVYDEDTGYMWSEQTQTYFDEESGHYYNPEYEQWYNPDTEEWYEA